MSNGLTDYDPFHGRGLSIAYADKVNAFLPQVHLVQTGVQIERFYQAPVGREYFYAGISVCFKVEPAGSRVGVEADIHSFHRLVLGYFEGQSLAPS